MREVSPYLMMPGDLLVFRWRPHLPAKHVAILVTPKRIVHAYDSASKVAEGKPVRFIEMGCPAVDKGANQPNVFPDPKSSESAYPWYSNRARDDAMQRAWLEAMIRHYSILANNPVSPVYSGSMIDLSHSHVWCWDARLWPNFPLDDSWGDAPNWESGHWISGRLGAAPAKATIRTILDDAKFADFAIEPIPMVVDGVTTGTLGTARARLEALRPVYQFDAVESDGVIKVISRLGRAGGNNLRRRTRGRRSDAAVLPADARPGDRTADRDQNALRRPGARRPAGRNGSAAVDRRQPENARIRTARGDGGKYGQRDLRTRTAQRLDRPRAG
jgi:hypothetical protein